jgi:hypothetical protein
MDRTRPTAIESIKVAGAARSQATPDAVFSLLKNSDTWPRWSIFSSAELERADRVLSTMAERLATAAEDSTVRV